MKTARYTVLEALCRMDNDNAYSNLVIDKALEGSGLSDADRAFAARLFYGVLEREITLCHIIQGYIKGSIKRLDTVVRCALEMGLYQLLYMDSVPKSAAVNESVALVKQFRKASASGLVNAVLRGFIRNGERIGLPKEETARLSVEYSCPEWLVKKWLSEYGDDARSIIEYGVARPPVSVRVNTLKTSAEELKNRLDSENIGYRSGVLSDSLILERQGGIEKLSAYKDGLFHVQDISSQLCCMATGLCGGETVLDLCAAPGGKSFTMAELMGDKGEIYSYDIHKNRVSLIENGAKRLGITCIRAKVGDASEYNGSVPLADRILCDVPCSGLGVISRKPEIKRKSPEEISALPAIQRRILENAVRYLKVGGELIYSTCSLSRDENDGVIDGFLHENANFEGVSFLSDTGGLFGGYKATVFPKHFGSDGFFISKIRRIK